MAEVQVNERPLSRPARRPRIEEKRPAIMGEAIKTYALTGSMDKTGDALGISPYTVQELFKRNPEDFNLAKKALAAAMARTAYAAVHRSAQVIDECTAPQAAVVAGIYAQRSIELLAGQSDALAVNTALIPTLLDALGDTERQIAELSAQLSSDMSHVEHSEWD